MRLYKANPDVWHCDKCGEARSYLRQTKDGMHLCLWCQRVYILRGFGA